MNTADSIVTAINIPQNNGMFLSISCNIGIFSVFSTLDHSSNSRMMTNSLIYHEVFLRFQRIARFRREEFPRDQVELFLPFSKKFYHVVPIARTS